MSYTTDQLVTGAYYASGVVSREFETVTGTQFNDGLIWLNDIITEKTVDDGMIPYETTFNFDAVAGQEIYDIPNLITIHTLTFFLNTVRYSMNYQKRNEYFGQSRVETIQSLPYEWYFERGLGGGKLYIYFLPDQNYPIELHGIFRLDTVIQGQDLLLTLEQFYITYLRYALADRICAEFNYAVPLNVEKQVSQYEAYIDKKSRKMDLRLQIMSGMGSSRSSRSVNWSWVNLGRGYVP